MNCASCGHENRDEARFCRGCGGELSVACASCGAALPPDSSFCDACGTRVGEPAAEPAASTPRSPADYTPKHLAEKILQSKSALEGERKQVTVLFSDVKGSMELSEKVDPEEWHAVLDRFFQIMSDGVHRFEGTVNQYTGDGIMALFGAPIAHEDHAQRACYAALQLRDDLGSYAREVKRERGLNFSVRMGINSGDVVVGKIGDDLRMDYTAQGHTVGLAARMQELASPDTTYLTGHTASLVDGYFNLEDLGSFRVKGVADPVPVSQLTGLGGLRTRLDVSRARGLTRFVGRDDDFQTLENALEQCFAGNGGVVGLVADAGVGKSRLCYEFLQSCRARGLRTLEGQAVAHGKNIPFLPILQVLRAYFEISDQDSDRVAREKVAGRLLLLDEKFRDALPLLFDFLGVPDPERPAGPMDPDARQRQLFGVLRQLVHSTRREAPIITLIEDLHWLDAGSESWVAEMVDAVAGTPSLLVLNFRPEYRADWTQKSYYRQLPLSPLGPEAIRELLDDLLGTDPSVEGLAERIHERAQGNPFFTEEVIQSLIEGGNLEGTRGRYRLVTPVAELKIPGTVQSILAARIDRLLERAKQVLHTEEFPEPILEAVIELSKTDLSEALEVLKGSEFIYEQSLYPVAEYAFKHPLTQEVALNSQLRERRGRIHAEVARAIEKASGDKVDEQAALLAHHWEEAGEKLHAARWHRRAADRAGMGHAPEMMRHLRAVWDLLRDLPESPETMALRIEAGAEILTHGLRTGVGTHLDSVVAEGHELIERTEDVRARIKFLRGQGTYYSYAGKMKEGDALLQQAIDAADEIGDVEQGIAARVFQVVSTFVMGPAERSLSIADEALTLLHGVPELRSHAMGYDTQATLFAFRCWGLAYAGRLEEATREAARAVGRARDVDDAGSLSLTQGWASRVAGFVGDAETALAAATRSVEFAEIVGTPNVVGAAYLFLGRAYALKDERDRALETLEVARTRGGDMMILRLLSGPAHALALLRAGEPERALAAARAMITECREIGAELLCETRAASAREEIEEAIQQAQALASRTGVVARLPWVHQARALLARAVGDDATRERELGEALRLFAEQGATGHAERVARELEELRGR
jgi:class 3 adenylate cyclase/tetratricopeptide (TPR) repeat protein